MTKKYFPLFIDIALLLCFPILMSFFYLEEKFITSNYTIIQCQLDNIIPFIPEFIFAYVLWYPAILLPMFLFWKISKEDYRRYMYFFITGLTVSLLTYVLFRNGQNLRPNLPLTGRMAEHLVQILYNSDTNTNVCPSLHVILSFAVGAAIFHNKKLHHFGIRILTVVILSLICASTVFLKQHSLIDVLAGIIISEILYVIFYRLLPQKAVRFEPERK